MRMLQRAVVGVATGQVLCACVGSSTRAEYTIYGNAANLSARLMVKAGSEAAPGPVLCDYTTRQLAGHAASFMKLDMMQACVDTS